jgi:hypothetical protein
MNLDGYRVLVIGRAGPVGYHLVDRLIDQNVAQIQKTRTIVCLGMFGKSKVANLCMMFKTLFESIFLRFRKSFSKETRSVQVEKGT